MSDAKPKLRPVQTHFIEHAGRPAILLRDPLHLSDKTLAIPQELAALLVLCDGTRDLPALRAAMIVQSGFNLAPKTLQHFIDQLDEALLLDNDRFVDAQRGAVTQYRAAPRRKPSSAGVSYPSDPNELEVLLTGYMQTIDEPLPAAETRNVRALVSPHIDYARGGPIYGQVWQSATEAACEAERVIIFGTDHMGGEGRLTLTRQNYGTPWGDFPTDLEAVDAVAAAIGDEAAFGEELHHISEHSIELALVWLHYIRRGAPCRLVPILCGSFEPFVSDAADPAQNENFAGALRALRQVMTSGRTLVVAAADLSHVGQAFGDMLPVDFVARMRLRASDEQLIAQICRGSADGFLNEIKNVGDKFHVCGLPPIYLLLRLLSKSVGQPMGYLHCPADEREESWVSICGVAIH